MSDADEVWVALRKMFPEAARSTHAEHRKSYDPTAIDRELAQEQTARKVRRSQPKHAAPALKAVAERKPWNAQEAFSIVRHKREKRNRRRAARGPCAPRGRTSDARRLAEITVENEKRRLELLNAEGLGRAIYEDKLRNGPNAAADQLVELLWKQVVGDIVK